MGKTPDLSAEKDTVEVASSWKIGHTPEGLIYLQVNCGIITTQIVMGPDQARGVADHLLCAANIVDEEEPNLEVIK